MLPQLCRRLAPGAGLQDHLPTAVLELDEQLARLEVLAGTELGASEGAQHLLDFVDRFVAAGGALVGEAHWGSSG